MSTAPSTPSLWAEVHVPDLTGAALFYRGLFGWAGLAAPLPRAAGSIFTLHGRAVAGATSPCAARPTWVAYLASSDVDAALLRVRSAGGRVLASPRRVAGRGQMVTCLDRDGTLFGVWQPARPTATLIDAPGALTWTELSTRRPDTAVRFYGAVFGWRVATARPVRRGYTEFRSSGAPIAGLMPMDDSWPLDFPPHWMVYFAVADTDSCAARATDLGGTTPVPPTDIPGGRFAVIRDPWGAVFSIITPVPPAA